MLVFWVVTPRKRLGETDYGAGIFLSNAGMYPQIYEAFIPDEQH
jgi:hypothetical protein